MSQSPSEAGNAGSEVTSPGGTRAEAATEMG